MPLNTNHIAVNMPNSYGKGLKQILIRQQTYEGPNHVAMNMPTGNWLQNTPPISTNNIPPKLPRRSTLTNANLENLETVDLTGPEWNIKVGNKSEEIPEVLKPVKRRRSATRHRHSRTRVSKRARRSLRS